MWKWKWCVSSILIEMLKTALHTQTKGVQTKKTTTTTYKCHGKTPSHKSNASSKVNNLLENEWMNARLTKTVHTHSIVHTKQNIYKAANFGIFLSRSQQRRHARQRRSNKDGNWNKETKSKPPWIYWASKWKKPSAQTLDWKSCCHCPSQDNALSLLRRTHWKHKHKHTNVYQIKSTQKRASAQHWTDRKINRFSTWTYI